MNLRSVQLDRFLKLNSQFSQRQLRQFIIQGQVTIDGEITKDIRKAVNAFTRVTLGESVIQQRSAHYIMLNKPASTVSATEHHQHRTVIDCITEPFRQHLHLAGRLDLNTTGLLLLTNDGHWSRALTQPKNKIPKTYLVETESPITDDYIERFSQGMYFSFENINIQPAKLTILSTRKARLTIYEGRYHQVKRMFGYFNNKVTALHRESVSQIELDPHLKHGEYRSLNLDEINSIQGQQHEKQSTASIPS